MILKKTLVEGGHFLDPTTFQPTGKFLNWRFLPSSVGMIFFFFF